MFFKIIKFYLNKMSIRKNNSNSNELGWVWSEIDETYLGNVMERMSKKNVDYEQKKQDGLTK